MNTLRRTLLTLILGALVVLAAPGQTQKKTTEEHAVPRYDLAQEVKVKGEILEVKNYDCPISGTMGVHLALQTAEGVVEVHLAPSAFLAEYQISFAKGDKVEVLGTKVTFHDMPALLARRVTRAQDDFTFRDPKGNPLWASRSAEKKGAANKP
jgi:DNA/RNA endonuclease YhcR with UshA esterase domain